jgi:hypothetical protein
MSQSPAGQRLLKLGLLALLCALPFLLAIILLERHVERIDTLPVDEYKDLVWAPDGRTLLLLHRPLQDGSATELWSGGVNIKFEKQADLSSKATWALPGKSVDQAILLTATEEGDARLALFQDGAPTFLEIGPEWEWVPSQGEGLFFSKLVSDVAFDQMVEVEDAPEVSPTLVPGSEASPGATPSAPTRSGLQIGRYNRQSGAPDVLLTIPFDGPQEKPRVLLARESSDQRFLALVTQFGATGTAGLWVYDSEASRLLWTRVVTQAQVAGLDWSQSSVALALCDTEGVVVLDNVLSIESTRYEAKGLGEVKPLFGERDELYLVGSASLHRLDRQAGQAEVVFDCHAKGLEPVNFSVNPSVSKVALLSSPNGFLELLVFDLGDKDAKPVTSELPGSLRYQAQQTKLYKVGDALRTALSYWKN